MNQLWSKILSMTPDDFNKIVLALVAIVALVLGPLMQWLIARSQVRVQAEIAKRQIETQHQIAKRQVADSIATRRQVWIDELRQDASEFLTLFARLEDLRRPGPNLSVDDQKKNFEDLLAASSRSTELGIRIRLRLNPKEGDHNELVRLLGVLSDACANPLPHETDEMRKAAKQVFAKARDNVISHLQTILKHEWERVKRGDV